MRWFLLLLVIACSAPIESEDITMNGFPEFGGAFDVTDGNIIPESGDAELDRLARTHGTGTGIRDTGTTNLGSVIEYAANEQRVKRALKGEAPRFDGMNWVITIVPSDSLSNGVWIRDTVVRITFGVGGGMSQLDVTPMPYASIAVPGLTAYADIVPDPEGAAHPAGSFTASLSRAMPNGDSEARLYQHFEWTVTDPGVNIPNFAKRLQVLGQDTSPVFGAGITLTFTVGGGLNFGLRYTGPQLLALKNAGTKIEVPAACKFVELAGLVANDPVAFSWDIEV